MGGAPWGAGHGASVWGARQGVRSWGCRALAVSADASTPSTPPPARRLRPLRLSLLCKLDFADMKFSLFFLGYVSPEQVRGTRVRVHAPPAYARRACAGRASAAPAGAPPLALTRPPHPPRTAPTCPAPACPQVPDDPVGRARWMFGLPGVLEL